MLLIILNQILLDHLFHPHVIIRAGSHMQLQNNFLKCRDDKYNCAGKVSLQRGDTGKINWFFFFFF
jgi:hypothetical protein